MGDPVSYDRWIGAESFPSSQAVMTDDEKDRLLRGMGGEKLWWCWGASNAYRCQEAQKAEPDGFHKKCGKRWIVPA